MFALDDPCRQAETALRSTNRATNGEILPSTRALVDTIRVRGPVRNYDQGDVRYRRHVDGNGEMWDQPTSATYRIQSDMVVRVDHLSQGRAPYASFEISVPRIVRNENTRGSTLDEVHDVVNWAFEEAAEHVDWDTRPETLRLTRVDLVNDFRVGNPVPLMRALARLRGTKAGKAVLHTDPGLGGVQTLRRGFPERWSVYAYDKHEEVLCRARSTRDQHRARLLRRCAPQVQGTMRVETRLRRDALEKAGLMCIGDLDDATLHGAADRYLTRAGFKEVLVGDDEYQARVTALFTGPDKRHAEAVLGYLEALRLGIKSPADRKTINTRKEIAQRYGLTSSAALLAGPSVALDFRCNMARPVTLDGRG